MTGVILTGLTGCGRPVAVAEPEVTGPAAEVCSALLADLPDSVMDQPRRETEPGVVSAAWGSPPITLRCGVQQPAGLTADAQCFEVNDVGWYAEAGTDADGAAGQVFTTIGRDVFVEVAVPAEYAPEAGALTFVADAIATHDPLHTPCV